MTEIEATEEELALLAALTSDELAALADADPEELAAVAQLAADAQKTKASKSSARPKLVEPPAPAVDEAAFASAGYHPPTIPATMADADNRTGFQVAEPAAGATHIAFEDGSTHAVDAKTGRISGTA